MPRLKFTVDSALLQELGERLVGKPYIALAELVKNSYDADSEKVIILLEPDKDRIEITDYGNGMNFEEFKDFWMRVGSIHKRKQIISRNLKRPLTGSKGIGRLAVQYLAREIEVNTVSEYDLTSRLSAKVNWEEAVIAGDLTEASAQYEIEKSDVNKEKGTSIILKGLKHVWDADQVKGLAQEIWWLQPPFRSKLATTITSSQKEFVIEFKSSRVFEEVFNWQIKAIMDIWHARITGKNDNGIVSCSLEYAGEDPILMTYDIPNCVLNNGDFEIRIYHLYQRQPFGIRVGDARSYLLENGGVYVYDGGFQLPFYGDPKNDWLKIEFDHSHRLSASQLLPKDLHIEGGMQFLPTLSRILGVVNVSTSQEPYLDILITRDRLQESRALDNLVFMIRYGLDYYALEEKKRSLELKKIVLDIERPKFIQIDQVLEDYRSTIPFNIFNNLRNDVKKVTTEYETETEEVAKRVSLMGPLATAGIASIATQHEKRWQIKTLDSIMNKIDKIEINVKDKELRKTLIELKKDIQNWATRTKRQQNLYAYFRDAENIKNKSRYSAKNVLEEVINQVQILAPDVKFDVSEVEYCRLPSGSLVEWGSIFQNVFLNSFNAMIDSKTKKIKISTKFNKNDREILIQDTGCGIDLNEAELLFEPFERRLKISPGRQHLEYGGSGLGLTIVRLIARNIGCSVSFIKPENKYNTAFSIRWREQE